MGITIHFEGAVGTNHDLDAVLQHARDFARTRGWPFVEIPEEVRSIARVRDEKDWDFVGLTSGIEISPHENCEPLRLEFDAQHYVQEYVKTQFAPLYVHISIVELLRQLQPRFASLDVVDESDYWDADDLSALEQSFARFFEVVEAEKRKNSRLSGPQRLQNGRIADLMEN